MKVAISVPIGAWHPLLPETLRSLEAQGDCVEVAFLDASGDARVANAINAFRGALTYHRAGPDKGQADAIVEGWKNTTAPVLGWLNADDALYQDATKIALMALQADHTLDVVY